MTQTLMDRFVEKVVLMPDGCWHWSAARHAYGYGKIGLEKGNGLAHRIAWALFVGPIPEGMFVCHRCDVPWCVNPAHLFLGTHQDNVDDMVAKGRNYIHPLKTHCSKGHAFEAENVYVTPKGARACRTCNRDAVRRYKARLAAEAIAPLIARAK